MPELSRTGLKREPRLVLIQEDDDGRRTLHLILTHEGFSVRSYSCAMLFLADTAVADAEYLVSDCRLPDGEGFALLEELRRTGWEGHAIIAIDGPSLQLRERALAAGYAVVLSKPLRPQRLISALRQFR